MRWLFVMIALAACGYRPPAQTNVSTASYQTDLASCEDTASTGVNKQNAKRAVDWFSSPVRRWGQIGDATQLCMVGKGYGRLRWCTSDELKSGTRNAGVVVTSSGVQCTDPPSPEHRTPT